MRFHWGTCLALLITLSSAAWGAPSRRPVVYDITPLTLVPSTDTVPGDVRQIGGKIVELGFTWSEGTRVLFEDLMPGANWAHPAKYKVLDARGKVIREVPTNLPPMDLGRAKPLTDDDLLGIDLAPVNFKIDDFKGALRVKEPGKFHALLINGYSDERHWNDFAFLYRVLTQVYGYLPAQIHVADSVNKDKKSDLDGSGIPRIRYPSTVAGVRELMGKLKAELKPDDQLLVAVNDHGETKNGESTLILFDGEMRAGEFATLLNAIPTERVVSIFGQCFSGGFVRPVAQQGKRIAMSASHNDEYSWATTDLRFNEFFYHVIAAFGRQTHEGQPVPSDRDGDNRISAQEAFAYALARDTAAESPLLEAPRNSGLSALMGLAF